MGGNTKSKLWSRWNCKRHMGGLDVVCCDIGCISRQEMGKSIGGDSCSRSRGGDDEVVVVVL